MSRVNGSTPESDEVDRPATWCAEIPPQMNGQTFLAMRPVHRQAALETPGRQEIPEDAYGAAEFGVMSYEILSITTITHFVFFELF